MSSRQHISSAMLFARVAVGAMIIGSGVAAAQPLSAIIAPPSDFKLRQGQITPVTITVDGHARLAWTLSLEGPDAAAHLVAQGIGAAENATVAQIASATLTAGETYTLSLVATDATGSATVASRFSIPDPPFALLPLDVGNMSRLGLSTYAVDAAGRQVVWPPMVADPTPITLLNLQTGYATRLGLPIANNEGVKFSGDGTRLYFKGRFRLDGAPNYGLGFVDLASQALSLSVPDVGSPFFSVDRTGRHVVYHKQTETAVQYALYTEGVGAQQLTNSPDTIAPTGTDCLAQFGTRPFITQDGETVVFLTASTLGLVPADPAVGCRVFSYDVTTQTFTQRAALPSSLLRIDIPALSDDGRWLSFPVIQKQASGTSRGQPALVDLDTGTLALPVIDTNGFTSFDSAVTGNAAGVIISTEADLDPRVGNEDHNLELFYYDRATGHIDQITETTAGIGRTPGGCRSYRPSISADGAVMAFGFLRESGEGCYLDGPQRNEEDGFNFGFVRAVRKRPGNQPVVLDPIPDQRVVAGTTLTLALTAHDPDNDPVNFFAQTKDDTDVPPGSTITDNYDGTGTFVWPTTPAMAGQYILRVAAFDEGGGEQFQDVAISIVVPSHCTGDCNDDGQVTVDELLTGVNIILQKSPISACAEYDQHTGPTIADVVTAVHNALEGCGSL